MWLRSGGVDPGRDGCRIPIPWSGAQPPYGFSADGAERAWLDQPGDWEPLTVSAESQDPASMLSLYRAGLRLRREAPWEGAPAFRWLPTPEGALAFGRGERFACIVNFGPDPVELPAGADVLIASNELEGGAVPQDTTVWLRQAKDQAPAEDDSLGPGHSIGQVKERQGR
jgi:alpha-glucosidase